MKNKLLEAKNIIKIYNLGSKNPYKALDNISLKVYEGEFISIMGPSGSGKSTLLNNISTIDIPTKGNLLINGKSITVMSEKEIGKFRSINLGFVFQEYNLLNSLTIFENISVPLTLQKCKPNIIKEKVLDISKILRIDNILDKFPNECSGGQQQRAAICRALVVNPKIIIADEPTGNLDSKNSHELLMFLKKLNIENNLTIIMVTHDAEIASYSSKIFFIKDGKIEQMLEKGVLTQKEYCQKIMEINSENSQQFMW